MLRLFLGPETCNISGHGGEVGFLMKKKGGEALIYSVCLFLWCVYSPCGQSQAANMSSTWTCKETDAVGSYQPVQVAAPATTFPEIFFYGLGPLQAH